MAVRRRDTRTPVSRFVPITEAFPGQTQNQHATHADYVPWSGNDRQTDSGRFIGKLTLVSPVDDTTSSNVRKQAPAAERPEQMDKTVKNNSLINPPIRVPQARNGTDPFRFPILALLPPGGAG
jgi:hypothetical protein